MVEARWNGLTIAKSEDTVAIEGNHYFLADSVDATLLKPTSRLNKKPVTLADAVTIGIWIGREWKAWAGQLLEPFVALVDVEPACPSPAKGRAIAPKATGEFNAVSLGMGATTDPGQDL